MHYLPSSYTQTARLLDQIRKIKIYVVFLYITQLLLFIKMPPEFFK